MQFMFKKLYFGPNGFRYRPNEWHTLPEDWFLCNVAEEGKRKKMEMKLPRGCKMREDPVEEPEADEDADTKGDDDDKGNDGDSKDEPSSEGEKDKITL